MIRKFLAVSFIALLPSSMVSAQTEDIVYWNDTRVVVSSPAEDLTSTSWSAYNTTSVDGHLGCGTTAYTENCGGLGSLCNFNDSASLLFNGTSVTVNFLARWNGVVNASVFLDGQLWTQVNTSNFYVEPFFDDLPWTTTQCLPISATTSGLSPDVQHNITIQKPTNDPTFGFVLLFQSFEYTPVGETTQSVPPLESASAPTSSSHTNVGAIVGGTIGGLVLLAAAAAFIFFVLRRKQQTRVTGQSAMGRDDRSEVTLADGTTVMGQKDVDKLSFQG